MVASHVFSSLPGVPGPRLIREDNRILYFARDRVTFRYLSHFYPAPIRLDGEVWPTVEPLYRAQKSLDPGYRRAILSAGSPGRAKRLAARPDTPRRRSAQSWFRTNGALPRADWNAVKLEIMRRGDWAKFTQHEDLGAALRATSAALLVEDSRADPYWGIGPDGRGENWAGRVLMEIRHALRAASP